MLSRSASNNNENPCGIAVIGGGRWARTVAGVLGTLAAPDTPLYFCSPSYPAGWDMWLESHPEIGQERCRITSDLDALLGNPSVGVVMVVREARRNASTAMAALKARKVVFVEKPFAVNLEEAHALIAASQGRFCVTGLVLLFASNLHRFVEALPAIGEIRGVQIIWSDALGEVRHHETKTYDVSLNVAQDVFSHVWSLLRLIDPDAPLVCDSARAVEGGRGVELKLRLGSAHAVVEVERDAESRRRMLTVCGKAGQASIDFAQEPGLALLNGEPFDVETGYSGPLGRELEYVIGGSSEHPYSRLSKIEHAVESIALAEGFMPLIREDQYRQVERGLRDEANAPDRKAADFALREIAADRLCSQGTERGGMSSLRASRSSELWTAIHCWLRGKDDGVGLPAGIRDDANFLALKKRLQRPDGLQSARYTCRGRIAKE